MGLNIKTYKQILNDMATWTMSRTTKLTNFFVGSVIRTIYEAVAVEVESLYFFIVSLFKKSVETSLFDAFDFTRTPAVKSTGSVTLLFNTTLTQNTVLPAGFVFQTIPLYGKIVQFETSSSNTFPSGTSSATVSVVCREEGIVGNVPISSIKSCLMPLAYISQVYNSSSFTNGRDEETVSDCKKRFSEYINSLSKGTISAVQYACANTSGVFGVFIEEKIGVINAYVHDSDGNLPSVLKTAVDNNVYNYRPGGIPVKVLPVTTKQVDITCKVILPQRYSDSLPQSELVISGKLNGYLTAWKVGTPLYISDVIYFLKSISEIPVVYAQVSAPSDTVSVLPSELIRPGTISVTCEVQ